MSRGGQNDDPDWLKESTQDAAVAVAGNKEVQRAVTNAATDHVKQKYLPGHSLTHSLTHSLIPSLTVTLTPSLLYSLTHTFTHSHLHSLSR
jgi:hypothetical protein